jgi:hypothetical protein
MCAQPVPSSARRRRTISLPGGSRGQAQIDCGWPARHVISWASPGLPSPTRSRGRSSAGITTMRRSGGSGSREGIGVRPSLVWLGCRSRLRSPSPGWERTARCSGSEASLISTCAQIKRRLTSELRIRDRRMSNERPPTGEGGMSWQQSGRRRTSSPARPAGRASRSRRRRPRAESSWAAVFRFATARPGLSSTTAEVAMLGALEVVDDS